MTLHGWQIIHLTASRSPIIHCTRKSLQASHITPWLNHNKPEWVVCMRWKPYKDFKMVRHRHMLRRPHLSPIMSYTIAFVTYEERWRHNCTKNPDFTNNTASHPSKATALSSMLLNFMYSYSFSADVFLNGMVSPLYK